MDTLYIVIPAYNEEENIEAVAREWHEVVEKIGGDSRLVIIDDGGKDSTYQKLLALREELPYLEPVTKTNSGHGGTVLFGYQLALERGADYIFQTDSDGQTLPAEFPEFWEARNAYDCQIGFRKGRQDGLSRIVVTRTLRLVLFFSFGLWVKDANTPFRLMRASTLKPLLPRIPQNYNLSNVLVTVMYEKRRKKEKSQSVIRYLPITFRPRQGGVNSINFKKITKIGRKALKDFMGLRKSLMKEETNP